MNSEPITTGDTTLIGLAEADTLEKFRQATNNWMNGANAQPFKQSPTLLRECHCGRTTPINEWCACVPNEEIRERYDFARKAFSGELVDIYEFIGHRCVPREVTS